MTDKIHEKVSKLAIKYTLGDNKAFREDLGVLLNEAYEEGFSVGLGQLIQKDEKKRSKKAKE